MRPVAPLRYITYLVSPRSMLSLLKTIGVLVLALLALGIGVVLLPAAWMITFGLIVPGAVIAAMPLRVLHAVCANSGRNRWMFLLLLLPWGYFLGQVISRGFVSKSSLGEGPTVNPYAWLGIAITWACIELIFRGQCLSAKKTPNKLLGTDTQHQVAASRQVLRAGQC